MMWTPIGFKDFDALVARPLEDKIRDAVQEYDPDEMEE